LLRFLPVLDQTESYRHSCPEGSWCGHRLS